MKKIVRSLIKTIILGTILFALSNAQKIDSIKIEGVQSGYASIDNISGGALTNGYKVYVANNILGPIYFPAYSKFPIVEGRHWTVYFRIWVSGGASTYYLNIASEPPLPWNPFFSHVTDDESQHVAINNFTNYTFAMGVVNPDYSSAPSQYMNLEVKEDVYGIDPVLQSVNYSLRTDADAPSSSVIPFNPTSQTSSTIHVVWSGTDGTAATSSGIEKYDIQVKVDNGSWTDWLTNVSSTTTSATYSNGSSGHTYYFQSRAHDNVGNVENYPGGNGDAWVYIQPPISVTVGTSPSGRSFSVDGISYTMTQVLSWTPGSSHTIASTSPQSGETGIQYIWSSWNDGGSMSHTVTPTSGMTYTANFTTQYYLTTAAGTGGNVSPSSGWYNSGQTVGIDATVSNGYTFSSWSGSGSGSYSGTTKSTSVTMNGPITETASFKPLTGIQEIVTEIPMVYSLAQNYPNPFNPSTTMQYGLPARSTVRLVIYNILGQVVKELLNTDQHAGFQSMVWNATVASGMYFYRIEAISIENPSNRFIQTNKMLLLK